MHELKAEETDASAVTGGGVNNMLFRNGGRAFVLGVVLTFVAVSIYAQQKVYRWVDEDGVVHVSDRPPDESESVETKTITTAPPPTNLPTAQPVVKAPAVSDVDGEKQSAQPEIESPPVVEKTDITKMSHEALDRRCEDAREKKIAPLREAEIATCMETETGDHAWCETFWADYGDPSRTVSGPLTPRLFHDLPECVEALDERHRRVSR